MADTHEVLRGLVELATCKPGWAFRLAYEDDSVRMEKGPLRLHIFVSGPDSQDPGGDVGTIIHVFPVPTATYNLKTWRRWIFECCRRVENHELGEWFKVDGLRPFPPLHGPGEDPYTIHEFRDEIDARTLQGGNVVEHLS